MGWSWFLGSEYVFKTVHEVVVYGVAFVFTECEVAHAAVSAVHFFFVPADEIVPVGQAFAFMAQAVGAAGRQPGVVLARQLAQAEAVRHLGVTAGVVAAAPAVNVQ